MSLTVYALCWAHPVAHLSKIACISKACCLSTRKAFPFRDLPAAFPVPVFHCPQPGLCSPLVCVPQDSLLRLKDYRQCFECSEVALNEAFQQMINMTAASAKEEWVATVTQLLAGIDCALSSREVSEAELGLFFSPEAFLTPPFSPSRI